MTGFEPVVRPQRIIGTQISDILDKMRTSDQRRGSRVLALDEKERE